jgi:hypothetical protein
VSEKGVTDGVASLMSVTLAKQIEGWLRKEGRLSFDNGESHSTMRRRPFPEEAEEMAEMLASHFQPVTAEEVVEKMKDALFGTAYLWQKLESRNEAARAIAEQLLEVLGPAYVVKE